MTRPTERARRRTTLLVASASPAFEKRAAELFPDGDFETACAFEWEKAALSVTRTQPGLVLVDGSSAAGHVHAVAAEAAARGIPLLIAHGTGDAGAVRAAACQRMPHGVFVVVAMTRTAMSAAVAALMDTREREAVPGRRPGHVGQAAGMLTPSPACAASRGSPLLILHDAHSMRCWPTGPRRGTRIHHTAPIVDWVIEIDGMVEHLGPPSDANATSREVVTRIRRWWDAARTTPARAPVVTSRVEG